MTTNLPSSHKATTQNKITLPFSTPVFILGIVSLVVCMVGLITSILTIILAEKDLKLYKANPDLYTSHSYNQLKIGRTCAIIGLVLNVVIIIFYILYIVFILALVFKPLQEMGGFNL